MVNIVVEYINYCMNSKKRHGIHSPFIYEISDFLSKTQISKDLKFQRKRFYKKYIEDKTEISISDFGAGSKKMENKTEIFQQKATSIPLIHLSRSIFSELNKYPHFLDAVDIIIENQPVLKNPTMKSIQMVLYSYFISKETNGKKFDNMVLISASNKLKVYNGPKDEEIEKINKIKSKYTRNKKLAIEHCKKLVTDNKWLDFFNNFSKKDDLADAYLMCRYYLLKNK